MNVARMVDGSVVYGVLVGRPDGKRPLGRRRRRRWKDNNINMDFEVEWGSVYWFDVTVNRDRWRAVVSAVVNIRVKIIIIIIIIIFIYCNCYPVAVVILHVNKT